MDSFVLLNKLAIFKKLFATISNMSQIRFTCRRFILLLQTKEVISKVVKKQLKTTKMNEV